MIFNMFYLKHVTQEKELENIKKWFAQTIEIYASSESWINNISIDVWFVMIGQYLKKVQQKSKYWKNNL